MNLKPFSEWKVEQQAALSGFKVIIKNAERGAGETHTVHKIRMTSKEKALYAFPHCPRRCVPHARTDGP